MNPRHLCLIAALALCSCGDGPFDTPFVVEAERPGCESDDDCPDGAICHGTETYAPSCRVPCLFNEQCPEGTVCGFAPGETQGVRVCVYEGEA